jgi:phospholipid transport system substrate-binding protein
MMLSFKRIVQVGFIGSLLGGGAAMAADAAPAKAAPTAVDASGPSELIESSANILLSGIDAHRAEFRKDPTGLYKLVGETLLPNFDTPYSAQLVLGTHWRTATPDQRKRFVDAFYHSLLYTYGDAMIDFTADRLRVIPTKVAPTDERATVRTEIKRSNGTKVAVGYSLRKVNGVWKAWDVVIDGISYVKPRRMPPRTPKQKRLEERAADERRGEQTEAGGRDQRGQRGPRGGHG